MGASWEYNRRVKLELHWRYCAKYNNAALGRVARDIKRRQLPPPPKIPGKRTWKYRSAYRNNLGQPPKPDPSPHFKQEVQKSTRRSRTYQLENNKKEGREAREFGYPSFRYRRINLLKDRNQNPQRCHTYTTIDDQYDGGYMGR